MATIRAEIHHTGTYELVLPSDLKKDGKPKYYRSQHLLHSKRAKQVKAHGYEKSMQMHDKRVAMVEFKQNRAESQRQSRRERRQMANRIR